MYLIFSGFPRKGILFCSIVICRTLNGRHRTCTPTSATTLSIRMTVRYVYVLPMKKKKSMSFAMIFLTFRPNQADTKAFYHGLGVTATNSNARSNRVPLIDGLRQIQYQIQSSLETTNFRPATAASRHSPVSCLSLVRTLSPG